MISLQLEHFFDSPENYRYLLAVSGGPDSMVLLELFRRSPLYFEVAHVNYGLRAEQSHEDEALVKTYCEQFGILCHVLHANTHTYIQQHKVSLQVAARNLRYQFFEELLHKRSLNFIVTAHHLNDHIETLLYSLIKNNPYEVFEDIPKQRGKILRPFLNFSKNDIISFAKQEQIPFRIDQTNSKSIYQRNFIRLKILPLLQELNPNIEKHLIEKWKNYRRKKEWLCEILEAIKRQSMRWLSEEVCEWNYIQTHPTLLNTDKLLLFFQYLSEHAFFLKKIDDEALLRLLLHSQRGRYLEDERWLIFKEREGLSFVEKSLFTLEPVVLHEPSTVKWAIFTIQANENLPYPLTLRYWKDGDRFKNKKIKDILTRSGVPSWFKQLAFVVENQYSGEILYFSRKIQMKHCISY